MPDKINDGGHAFPLPMTYHAHRGIVIDADEYSSDNVGMSLRDWFAGQALACRYVEQYVNTPGEMACLAYVVADAMLRAREVQHD